jgi:hypothetical protein
MAQHASTYIYPKIANSSQYEFPQAIFSINEFCIFASRKPHVEPVPFGTTVNPALSDPDRAKRMLRDIVVGRVRRQPR